jgi:hypothetical protein
LEEVYQYGLNKGQRIIEELTEQGLYLPDKYVERKIFTRDIEAFLSSSKKIMIIAGESGSGKTSSLIHLSKEVLLNDEMVDMVRCEGLPAEAVNPDKLERTLTEELGYKGKFEDIVNWFEKKNKRFYLIFEGMNEFVGPGKDLGRFFESINTVLSRYRDQGCLKIIISTTSGTVPYFLNERKVLPESMAEEKELYFHGEEGDIYGFRKFNEEELKTVAENYEVPYWAVEEVRKNKKIDLLNPRQFRIFAELFKGRTEEEIAELKGREAHREIVKEMLKYSGYKLANKHINTVMRKDKKLLKTLQEIAQFMDKQKDLSPSWSLYEDKNPRLAGMLKENNWEKLRKLKELQLVKEERMIGNEGVGEWKLSFAHDKVYDFLTKKLLKKYFISDTKRMGILLLLFVVIMLFFIIRFSIETPSGSDIDHSIKMKIEKLGPVSEESMAAYKDLTKFGLSFIKLIKKTIIQVGISGFAFLFLFVSLMQLTSITGGFTNLVEKLLKEKRDNRIKYLYWNFVVKKLTKEGNKFLIILLLIIISAFLYRRFTKSLTVPITIFLVLLLLIFYLISILRSYNAFIKKSKSKSIFLYSTDNFAVKRSILYSLYGSIRIGILIFIFYISISTALPLTFVNPVFDYGNGRFNYINVEDPLLLELVEKKWIKQEAINKVNNDIKGFQEMFENKPRIFKEILEKYRVKMLCFIFWILFSIFFSFDIIYPYYLRKKLGPFFR